MNPGPEVLEIGTDGPMYTGPVMVLQPSYCAHRTETGGSDGLDGRQYIRDRCNYPRNTNSGMHDLTGFQRDLLYVIAGLDDPHGLAIKEELETYYETEIHHGRLYPNLDTLVDKGLVEKGEKDRRTNRYAVTRRGRRELEDRREWEDEYLDEIEATAA